MSYKAAKTRVFVLLTLLLVQVQAYAQKEATNWYFGNNVGLDFSQGAPVARSDGAMLTLGGCAVISDKDTGELLFYTNGHIIWNRNHQIMPYKENIPAICPNAYSQPALIVPVPGDEHRFYVFTALAYVPDRPDLSLAFCTTAHVGISYTCAISYSVVDMRLNGGLGGVLAEQKNTVLQRNATQKLTAIPHANGADFWLLTHAFNSDAFYIYLVSSGGISEASIQHIGSRHVHKDNIFDYSDEMRGVMKASPDGRKLACAVDNLEERPFDLFDFDAATGQLSNYINLGNLRSQHGVSFSPDNTKLYVSTHSPPGTGDFVQKDLIRQYDLAAGSAEAIIASGTSIIARNPFTNLPQDKTLVSFSATSIAMQLAPDGKIYAVSDLGFMDDKIPELGKTIVVINRPNEKGFASRPNYRLFDFETGGVAFGLPNFIQSYFNGLEPIDGEPERCAPIVELYPNPTTGKVRFAFEGDCTSGQKFSLSIVNSIGQEMMREQEMSVADELDIFGYASGLYIFIITFPDEQQVVKKVMKIR